MGRPRHRSPRCLTRFKRRRTRDFATRRALIDTMADTPLERKANTPFDKPGDLKAIKLFYTLIDTLCRQKPENFITHCIIRNRRGN